MPLVDKPDFWCRVGMSELWDALVIYVDFVESFGVSDPLDCVPFTLPSNNDVEDAGCQIMCSIVFRSPIARCIIPISPTSFIEVDCSSP